MIEAMACGTPVIAFPQGSVREVLEDGVTGFLVESVEDGIVAVERLAELSRERCRAEFEKRFSVGRMAENYLEVYSRLAKGTWVDREPVLMPAAG
jgi:glycosyltransferase involved in cell wall biosynthesis